MRGNVVMPGTAYMEMALASSAGLGLGRSGSENSRKLLSDLILYEPLVLNGEEAAEREECVDGTVRDVEGRFFRDRDLRA